MACALMARDPHPFKLWLSHVAFVLLMIGFEYTNAQSRWSNFPVHIAFACAIYYLARPNIVRIARRLSDGA